MMRFVLIGAAFLAALAAVLLTRNYLTGKERQLKADAAPPMADVLVVTTDLDIGQIVSERNLSWQPWPKAAVNARYLTRERQPDAMGRLTGAAARQPLFAGEPVTDAKLVKRDGASVLAVVLRDGYRAVSIKVDEAQGLAGLVKPGDTVDVLLTHKVMSPGEGERGQRNVAEVIAERVRVLGVGQEIRGEDDKNKPAKTITVEVDPGQAEAVALGRMVGSLSLALRSAFAGTGPEERAHAYTGLEDISSALRDQYGPGPVMLVARRALPAGTLLAETDLAWVPAAADSDRAMHFVQERARPAGLRGALLLDAVAAGGPLPRSGVVRATDPRFVPLALRPGHRAISVAIAPNSAVGGFISAGDRVDVLFTDDVNDLSQGAVLRQRSWSETVASNVRVLSIETSLNPKTQLPSVGGTATVEVTPPQAEAIALAASIGKLTLALRPAVDTVAVAQGGASPGGPLDGSGFTVDRAMSRGLDAIVEGNGGAATGTMVVFRGSARTVVPLQR